MKGSCHCGAVRFEVDSAPTELSECNCSLCRRVGGLWAYYPPEAFRLTSGREALVSYIQGDRTISNYHCRTCGCTSHWEGLPGSGAEPGGERPRVGVNMRLAEGLDLEAIPLRKVDGASF
jgi:hypothetical protein